MKMALCAKVTINPRRLHSSRWVHDTAHALINTIRKAKDEADRPEERRRKN